MPKAVKYLDPNDKLRPGMGDITQVTEREDRYKAYENARKYYNGDHPRILDIKEDERDDNVTINVFQQAIDRIIAFLFPQMPDLEIDPDTEDMTPDEQWLADAWASNGGIELLQEMAMDGCFTGHVYVRVLPPDRSQGDEYPQILLLDPGSVITYWQADNVKRVLWHEIRWTVPTETVDVEYLLDVVNMANHPDGARWMLYQYRRVGAGAWNLEKEELWPFAYGPIVQWKHLPNPHSFYGKGETDNLELNVKLSEVTSENNRIIRYHSGPRTIGTGVQSSEEVQRAGTDELWTVENENAKFYNLEMKSDLTASREHADWLYDTYLAERRVVILRGDVKDFQRVTNAGVRTVFMDMLSKNTVLRWNYGSAIREISRRLFMLKDGRTDVLPTVIHADPLPTDQLEAVTVAQMEDTMKIVSKGTLSARRGYNWKVERQKIKDESEDEALNPAKAMENNMKSNQVGQTQKSTPQKE